MSRTGPPESNCYFTVRMVEPPSLLVLHSDSHLFGVMAERNNVHMDWAWTWMLTRTSAGGTRLLQRTNGRLTPAWAAALYIAAIVPADFVMARSHLRGIKQRVEAHGATVAGQPTPPPPADPVSRISARGSVMMMNQTQSADRNLWVRWVAANTAAETVGLTITAAVFAGVAPASDSGRGLLVAAAAMALVAAGAFEGGVVGYVQWRVLRRPLPALPARSWIAVTVLGAVVAWSAGLLPSTLMSMSSQGAGEPSVSPALQLLLAAAMGLALGPVLGVPQWWILREHVDRAGWWVAANALAWAAGMPVTFLAAGGVPADASVAVIVAAVVAACVVTGAVVGAVHGIWLVWLLRAAPQLHEPKRRRAGPGQGAHARASDE